MAARLLVAPRQMSSCAQEPLSHALGVWTTTKLKSSEERPVQGVRGLAVFDQYGIRSDAPMRIGHRWRVSIASRAPASERSQRTFITMKVRSSYCSASRIQSFISSESRALISLAGR